MRAVAMGLVTGLSHVLDETAPLKVNLYIPYDVA